MRVLIVEDEALTALALAMVLEAEGHGIVGIAHTSRQGEEFLRRELPEVAFVDIDLEERGAGLLLAQHLHEHHCGVIFTTGRPELARTCDCAIGLLSKPYDCLEAAHSLRAAECILRGEIPPRACIPSSLELLSGASASDEGLDSILLVDDHSMDAELTLAALEKCHVLNPIVVVRDGIEAIKYLESPQNFQRIALVLLDIKMPRMDGLEVLKHLRQQARFSTLRIVMLTGSNLESDVRQCHDHGASDYVVKPTSLTDLAKELRRVTSCLGGATAR